jgi:hypothetical protein
MCQPASRHNEHKLNVWRAAWGRNSGRKRVTGGAVLLAGCYLAVTLVRALASGQFFSVCRDAEITVRGNNIDIAAKPRSMDGVIAIQGRACTRTSLSRR